ncbi:serine protease [Paenibacillus doosanensis]|uniref:Serine endoprotease DegS n=1 Tax=Paenibacillus konkukensis TaxID=2020716 RepID=A0ABY4RL44_9BACL|nr:MULTISPECIES: serine protease [Paenibacillus]MCS7462397.1 serine protease [Paenibacillus doosanensis]UQZ83221.1 Serine endoprotease DegS [Paenibacillus konkukensis]
MKRKAAALGLGLLVLLLSGMSLFTKANADEAAVYNAEEMYERAQSAVFYIRALNADDALKATGTGVIISADGLAATACHVLTEAARLEAVLSDGRAVSSIEVLGCDQETDAALLKLPAPDAGVEGNAAYPALPIRDTAVKHGENVFALGYPMKDTPIITEGIINSPHAEINGRGRILTSAQIVSGMSGGPLIDRYGRLAGIISGSLKTMNNIHLVIPVSDLQSLLPKQ